MRVDCALLCDSVTVREGLLHILGGGIARVNRPGPWPTALGADLALRIMVHPTEVDSPHQATLLLQGEDGQSIAQIQIGFQVGDADKLRPGEEASVVAPIASGQVPIPAPGAYSFEILIDGTHQTSVPFFVTNTAEANPT